LVDVPADSGIRDRNVTGVQTRALPISPPVTARPPPPDRTPAGWRRPPRRPPGRRPVERTPAGRRPAGCRPVGCRPAGWTRAGWAVGVASGRGQGSQSRVVTECETFGVV